MIEPVLEGVIRPLDAARRVVMRTTWRVPLLGNAVRSLESRVPLLAALSVTLSLILTCFVPEMLFVLGPALLGVPHVASDLRCLVLRQRRPATWTMTVALGCTALLALRIFEMVTPRRLPFTLLEVSIGWGWIGAAAWLGAWSASSGPRWRRASLVTLPIAAVTAMAVAYPGPARALLAYAHNLVAPLIWLILFRGYNWRAALPLVLLGAGACLLLSGLTIPWLPLDDPWVAVLAAEAQSAMPMVAPRTALAVGLSYVFLQAVHYSIWLVWIPQEQIRGNATLTFRMSARAARRDFGAWGLALVLGASLAMVTASLVAVHPTRRLYLSIATFHAYLELACLAFLTAQRQQSLLPWRVRRADPRAT